MPEPKPRKARPPDGFTFTVVPAPGMTKEERLARRMRAVEILLAHSFERERRETQEAVAEGRACWLPVPPPPAFTEADLRKRPRYRPKR
jgi:hypothetical protein